jgi:hypothetical protein
VIVTDRCSFCGITKEETPEKLLVKGIAAAICRKCLKRCSGPEAHVAYCSTCLAVQGKHAIDCPEQGGAA